MYVKSALIVLHIRHWLKYEPMDWVADAGMLWCKGGRQIKIEQFQFFGHMVILRMKADIQLR